MRENDGRPQIRPHRDSESIARAASRVNATLVRSRLASSGRGTSWTRPARAEHRRALPLRDRNGAECCRLPGLRRCLPPRHCSAAALVGSLDGLPRLRPTRPRRPAPPSRSRSGPRRCGDGWRGRQAGTGRDQTADDDVFLQAAQVVAGAADGSFGQHAGGFLERGRRDERLGRQRGLGDAQQDGIELAGSLLLARALTFSSTTRCARPVRRAGTCVLPASVISTLRSIWRVITSMCLSLIFTPCRR